MSGRELTLWSVAAMCGKRLPELGRRGYCVLRKHKRKDKSLTVFRSETGDLLYKCFSCDPPDNVGDALALYAVLEGLSRRDAWHLLRERGYAVPGDEQQPGRRARRPLPPKHKPVPVSGRSGAEPVLGLELRRWEAWRAQRLGAVEQLGKARGLDPELLRNCDVVDVERQLVGFGYRDPYSARPCRVKMRPLHRKAFWIEPRPGKDERGKALGPLYLADRLVRRPGRPAAAVITEGELDALSLCQALIPNVVSLPDGAESAGRVDLGPLSSGFLLWLVSTDRDGDGQRAFACLRDRARALGVVAVRLLFGDGFKDANEALQAGFGPAEFAFAVNHAAAAALGYDLQVA